jgi:hypothetical protein
MELALFEREKRMLLLTQCVIKKSAIFVSFLLAIFKCFLSSLSGFYLPQNIHLISPKLGKDFRLERIGLSCLESFHL